MNRLLNEAVPLINAGKKPDVAALAKAYGVDEKVANQAIQHLLKLTRG